MEQHDAPVEAEPLVKYLPGCADNRHQSKQHKNERDEVGYDRPNIENFFDCYHDLFDNTLVYVDYSKNRGCHVHNNNDGDSDCSEKFVAF